MTPFQSERLVARADLIVSGDRRHLRPIGSHQGIAIVEDSVMLLVARRANNIAPIQLNQPSHNARVL
jgi:hypothetical protein